MNRDFIDIFEGAGNLLLPTDRIDLSTIDANTTLFAPGNQSFSFIGINAFSGAGQVCVDFSGVNTLVQVNTDFDAAPEMELLVDDGGANALNWVSTDFIL